ncbi:RNA-directed DNA polymerase-like protein [Cucumis melo var. makuwa]|uniref:RNA-directed DNA polymerase-like protein n=1 Tax=Cucumis melo var. makuwa TaxID=1194695 RepID=A0A5D3D0A9_CUCMM|nr:RNA-directed DNA polymerase-like protein [Cucumis melo var. makuwa]
MIDHVIGSPLPEAKLPAKNANCMALAELVEHRKQLKELLSTGFSKPVKAPYGAPDLSLKKDRSPRLCIDCRIMNKPTVLHKYPLSILTDLFDCSHRAKYFPKLDVRPRYC